MRLLTEGADLSLAQDLKSEYRLSQRFVQDNDFYEGVRAGLWVHNVYIHDNWTIATSVKLLL